MARTKTSAVKRRVKPKAPRVRAASAAPDAVLSLGTALSIREVGECRKKLQAMLAAGLSVVDVGEVQSVDSAGVQLLLAAASAARAQGLTLRVQGGDKLIKGAAGALGLSEHLAATAEVLP